MATDAKIPVIDISNPEADEQQVARDLVEAAIDHGFIYIKNLGRDISAELIDDTFDLSKKLFSASIADKERCKIQTNNRGWSGMHSETLDPKHQRMGDFKEAFNFGQVIDGKCQQPLPSTIAGQDSQIGAFWDACQGLCHRILYLLGLGLGVSPPDFFSAAHQQDKGASGTTLRLLRYPPPAATTADRELDVRAGAHSDYGSITLLFRLRGQAGLEILTRSGAWAPVPVSPPGTEHDPQPCILVNIGDLLSYWTNGLFRSTVHRVVFQSATATVAGESEVEPRYSIAFFCHPVGTMPLETVPSERVRTFVPPAGTPNAHAVESETMTADQHLQMRLKKTYLDLYKDEVKV